MPTLTRGRSYRCAYGCKVPILKRPAKRTIKGLILSGTNLQGRSLYGRPDARSVFFKMCELHGAVLTDAQMPELSRSAVLGAICQFVARSNFRKYGKAIKGADPHNHGVSSVETFCGSTHQEVDWIRKPICLENFLRRVRPERRGPLSSKACLKEARNATKCILATAHRQAR